MGPGKSVSENVSLILSLILHIINVTTVNIRQPKLLLAFALSALILCGPSSKLGQNTQRAAAAERGSQTAKGGFRNETEIRDKFNNWKLDEDARAWLAVMNYKVGEIESVSASKPHGQKADVEVRVKTRTGEKIEGVSIKLVSSSTGFNQIDKRWLANYAKMWKMPTDVVAALKSFVGETSPTRAGRNTKRMFLNELEPSQQKAVVDFFTANKDEIVSDIFAGDGVHDADWVMVALKATEKPSWIIRSSADTIKFFGEGQVEITRSGNLRIGRITMQRKGGDAGRETAKMLQFKINPVQLFEAK